jgi:hypothetical protein
MRSRAGVNRGPLDALTRGPIVAGGVLALAGLAYAFWRRRRRLKGTQSPGDTRIVDPQLDAASALYRALESALQLQGITRATSVPPLRHAEELKSKSHPLADEVLSLTHVYLEARFGGAALTDATRKSFERRIRGLRATRIDRLDAAR